MSRTFSNDVANFLQATGTAPSVAGEATFFGWVKDAGAGAPDRTAFTAATQGARRWFQFTGSQGYPGHFVEGNGEANDATTNPTLNVWRPAIVRVTDSGGGNYLWEVFLDNAVVVSRTLTVGALVATGVTVTIGSTGSGTNPFNGKVAHHAIWLRSLTNTEIADLSTGANPSTIETTGRFAYYPMIDDSLVNAWDSTPGSALTVNGTVPNDNADNPTVDGAVVPSSLTVTQTELTPGGTISGSYSNYATVPTTLTVSDGTNTITIGSPTINDNGDGTGTFSGTMPTLPTSGTANLVLFGNVTVELT